MEFIETSFLRLCLLALASQHLSTWMAAAQAEKPCEDALEDCSYYYNAGECKKHTGVTRQYCPRTCGYCATPPPTRQPECKDLVSDCATLIESPSQCHPAKDFFLKYCPRTCGYCACDDILPDCMSYVTNPDQCQSSLFFTKYCRKSCSFCEDQSALSTITPSTLSSPSARSSTTEYITAPKSSTNSSPAPKSPTTTSPPSPPSPPPSLSTQRPTVPPTNPPTTKRLIPPGPIGCSDLLPECASEVKKNPGSCKDNEEYMKEHCPESCKFCDVDPYCEDKMPKDCMTFLARDKEYCKTNPDFMRENCARSCEFCGCSDLLPICPALVENNKDYCDSNRLFMKTNCPMSCLFCSEASNISDEAPTNGDIEVKPPASEAVNDCVDKRKRCKLFAGFKNYCSYHTQFMSRYCPKACQFCEKEYNFPIRTEWNGVPINHAPVTFQIRAQDSRSVLISVSGPFFNDPGPPPSCASGSPCDGLWDYEVAEVFFLGKKEKYLEIELSPHGQHLLLLLNGVRKKFMDKLPIEYTATINRENNTWTGTAKIPIDYFPPDVRKINAYAIHGSGANRRYESLYPASSDVSNPDFHRLEFFKPFDLEAMFTVSWSKPLSPLWKNSVRRIMRARARI